MNTTQVAIYPNGRGWVWHFIPYNNYESTYVHGPFKTEALAKKDRWFAARGHPSGGTRMQLHWIPGVGPLGLIPPATQSRSYKQITE
jgi:hypothetical protein